MFVECPIRSIVKHIFVNKEPLNMVMNTKMHFSFVVVLKILVYILKIMIPMTMVGIQIAQTL